MSTDVPRLVVLISGRGSNLRSIVQAISDGSLPMQLVAVLSNRPDAAGLAFAQAAQIPTQVLDHTQYESREAFDADLAQQIEHYQPDFVVLAGFMRILSAAFVKQFAGRLVNIHPSLLPKYKGLNTHARALADGAQEHGASVHFVTETLDDGPVIEQARVPVLADDTPETLAARVLAAEHQLYPSALKTLAMRWCIAE